MRAGVIVSMPAVGSALAPNDEPQLATLHRAVTLLANQLPLWVLTLLKVPLYTHVTGRRRPWSKICHHISVTKSPARRCLDRLTNILLREFACAPVLIQHLGHRYSGSKETARGDGGSAAYAETSDAERPSIPSTRLPKKEELNEVAAGLVALIHQLQRDNMHEPDSDIHRLKVSLVDTNETVTINKRSQASS